MLVSEVGASPNHKEVRMSVLIAVTAGIAFFLLAIAVGVMAGLEDDQ